MGDSKEEYKPWKWDSTAGYHASHARTILLRGSPCQDPAGNRTTRWPPDHRKETQTAVVWACLPFIRSSQNHLAKGGRRQGRQKKRWEDNIREWTGQEFAKSQRAVENRQKWRKVVVKSSLVPKRSLRERDKWGEWLFKCRYLWIGNNVLRSLPGLLCDLVTRVSLPY